MQSFIKLIQTARFKKYFLNTGWMFFDKIFGLISTFAVGVFVARYLGPDRFGTLSFAISYAALFSPLVAMGIDNILLRELVKNPEDTELLLGSSLCLKLIGAASFMFLVSASLFLQSNAPLINALILIIASSYLFEIFNIFDTYNRALVAAKFSAQASVCTRFLASILRISFILSHSPLIYFAIAILIERALLSFFYFLFCKSPSKNFLKWELSFKKIKYIFGESWPLALSAVAILIYMRIDQIMLRYMLPDIGMVGYYAVAVNLTGLLYYIPVLICLSLAPSITNSRSESNKKYIFRLQQFYSFIFITSLIVIAGPIIFSNEIVNFLFGQQYRLSSDVFRIYCFSHIAVSLGVSSGQFLINEGLVKLSLCRSLIGMVSNILLNLALIPKFALQGAAYATVISYFMSVLSIALFKETRNHTALLIKSLLPINIFKNLSLKNWN